MREPRFLSPDRTGPQGSAGAEARCERAGLTRLATPRSPQTPPLLPSHSPALQDDTAWARSDVGSCDVTSDRRLHRSGHQVCLCEMRMSSPLQAGSGVSRREREGWWKGPHSAGIQNLPRG